VDWKQALRVTLVPHLEWSRRFLAVLVGILGTTISPYLFFWQAAEEVEEERAKGKTTVAQRKGASATEGANWRGSMSDRPKKGASVLRGDGSGDGAGLRA
jgi:Mn2+/Fe2+ NRAMP family transporter